MALVAVAAYKLSQTVITDKMTRLTVLASAGIACCCETLFDPDVDDADDALQTMLSGSIQ